MVIKVAKKWLCTETDRLELIHFQDQLLKLPRANARILYEFIVDRDKDRKRQRVSERARKEANS